MIPPRNRMGLTRLGPDAPAPFRHLIERYVHRARQVTCTCGWKGSSLDGADDNWKGHLAQVAPRRP